MMMGFRRAALLAVAVAALGCARQRAAEAPLGGKGDAKSASERAEPKQLELHAFDLDGSYQGGMTEVIQAYVRDAAEAKKRWDALEPPPGASRDQVLAAGDARLDLYLRLRNKLTRIADQQLWDAKTAALLDRAAQSDNQMLRDKALQAATNGSRAWDQKCNQELQAADGIVASQAALVWRLGQAQPGAEAKVTRAGQVLANLQAQRGDGWLGPIVERHGVQSRSGAFGAAPNPTLLPSCPALPNLVAPLGPLTEGSEGLPDGISLPSARKVVSALGEGPRVYVSTLGVYWGKERRKVVALGRDAASVGAPSQHKPAGNPNDLYVAPLGRAASEAALPKNVEVLLFADATTPYRVLVEVLFTLGKEGHDRILLVTSPSEPGKVQGLPVAGPSIDEASNVLVFVVKLGYALRIDGKRVGADCGSGDPAGMAVPRARERLDPEGLSRCLTQLLPDEAGRSAYVVANPETPYVDIIATTEVVSTHGRVFFGTPR